MNLYSTLQTAPDTGPDATQEAMFLVPQRFAHVVSMSGSQLVAVMEKVEAGSPAVRLELGSLVKVPAGMSTVLGLVSALSSPMPGPDGGEELSLVEVTLAGELAAEKRGYRVTFRRGVSTLPAIGEGVFTADWNDLSRIYCDDEAATVEVGALYQNGSVPVALGLDSLFGKHFVIAGAPSCGKSSALTAILQGVAADHAQARIVLFDTHNEYGSAFGEQAERIAHSELRLPYWLLNPEELTAAVLGTGEKHQREAEILSEAVLAAKQRYFEGMRARKKRSHAGLDTPLPFRFSDVLVHIESGMDRLNGFDEGPTYRRLKTRIEAILNDARCAFMFGGDRINDSLTEVVARIFRVPSDGRAITILELAQIPGRLAEVVIALVSRLAFELGVWSQGGMPLVLVAEDAHRLVPAGAETLAAGALKRILREGSKHGVGLGLVTERVSELDGAVLDACGTAIAMRLITERDQDALRGHAKDGGLGLLEIVPLLADREAIVLGAAAPMPIRLKVSDLPGGRAPRKQHLGFAAPWKQSNFDLERLEEAVARWHSLGQEGTN